MVTKLNENERIKLEREKAIRELALNDFKYLMVSFQNLMIKKQIMLCIDKESNDILLIHHKYGEAIKLDFKEMNKNVRDNPY